MASRRKARILAFQALFFWEANCVSGEPRVPVEELLAFAWLEEEKLNKLDENTSAFSRALIAGAVENITDIDTQIQNHLDNWDIVRLNRVDLAVLRISAYTLMYQKEIPASIVIDEAIGICREFGTDDSYKFVNGVLDSIKKTILENHIKKEA
ncbi:MAG: transcription antitermination factor NusB [Treponema sp.]|nr:transcription antitermination factor NusB [Treponema sp.]MCL2251015.1 transcription antitermination factor NusB [Treponema sp.]